MREYLVSFLVQDKYKGVNIVQGIKGTKERTETITLRCTPEEKQRIYGEAKKRHLTVTQYLIGMGLGVLLGEVVYEAIERKEDS